MRFSVDFGTGIMTMIPRSWTYLLEPRLGAGIANGCVVQVRGKESVTVGSSVDGIVPFRSGCGGLFGIEG